MIYNPDEDLHDSHSGGMWVHRHCIKMPFLPVDDDRYPLQRIVVNYTVDQEGQDIREEDVVHAANGIFFTEDELKRFSEKSSFGVPTYGNCHGCWSSGPVGKKCRECNAPGYHFVYLPVMVCRHRCMFDHKWVDAEWLSMQLAKGQHEIAKADQCAAWGVTPQHTMILEDFKRVIQTQFWCGPEQAHQLHRVIATSLEWE